MLDLKNKTIIGMIHLLPTIGFKGFTSIKEIKNRAVEDLKNLESGGVDAIMVENNYDLPHKIKVDKKTSALICYILENLRKLTTLPLGVSILFNDYESALSLAKISGCDFVRIPVFVDNVKTDFGDIKAEPKKIIQYRDKIDADNVLILTDIHVKHAELMSNMSISDSAIKAINHGTDGIIITGKWTGDSPKLDDLIAVKKVAGRIPIIIGSGASKENIDSLFQHADAVIVSTSLKEGSNKPQKEERNIKPYSAKIDVQKVREFVNEVMKIRRKINGESSE